MNLKLFTIFDSKAEAYMPIFSFTATGLAIRAFADMAADKNHNVGQHPADYTLFEIGEFNPISAEITTSAKRSLGTAIEFVGGSDD